MRDIRMEDLIARMKLLHPNLSETKIRAIIKEGCKNLTNEIKKGKDIQLRAIRSGLSFLVYKPHSNKKK
jgi:nucleoid DNA-binding protein